ncbi:hypothetical protein B0H16DRAFT_1513580 [Mycena metata]|uniref:Protein kinase domain-containing protein n=1 Tax=Mycena metata TaxID=1033252 RepID=A0AAD7JTA1_9AGAR|nr:hypothetical protein B0H16DRAFT_1513580 [Mycena metata]
MTEGATETDIGLYFSTSPQAAHPRNHCIPIYEVLRVPDDAHSEIVVMPALQKIASPRFDTFGELVEFLRQIFEGLQFMHAHHITLPMVAASSPLRWTNSIQENVAVGWDGKKHSTRMKCNPKHYFVDFRLSRKYTPADIDALESDPFPADIYDLANMITRELVEARCSIHFYINPRMH